MRQGKRLSVILSQTALNELIAIVDYNFERYGAARSRSYAQFLLRGLRELAVDYGLGRQVEGFQELKAFTLQQRAGGDGHVVIYEIDQSSLNVLHIFHSKMDILGRLRRER